MPWPYRNAQLFEGENTYTRVRRAGKGHPARLSKYLMRHALRRENVVEENKITITSRSNVYE